MPLISKFTLFDVVFIIYDTFIKSFRKKLPFSKMPPKNKKPDYSSATVSQKAVDSIRRVFDNAVSDTETDENGQPIKIYPTETSMSKEYTKVLTIQQAVTESLKKGATLLSKSRNPNT